jgi:hypothetical protein
VLSRAGPRAPPGLLFTLRDPSGHRDSHRGEIFQPQKNLGSLKLQRAVPPPMGLHQRVPYLTHRCIPVATQRPRGSHRTLVCSPPKKHQSARGFRIKLLQRCNTQSSAPINPAAALKSFTVIAAQNEFRWHERPRADRPRRPQRLPTRAAPSLVRALRDARGRSPWTLWTILCRLTGTTFPMQPVFVSTMQIAATLTPIPSAALRCDQDHRKQ